MRVIGLDVHRSFAQVAVLAGTEIVEERRLDLEHDAIVEFGRGLDAADEVVWNRRGTRLPSFGFCSPSSPGW